MVDVSLIYMPFGALERPSLGLGLLKQSLTNFGITCDVHYSNFEFAERIGIELYSKLAWVREEMIGEWIFSGAAFPDFEPDTEFYLDCVLPSFYETDDKAARSFGYDFLKFAREEAKVFVDEQARMLLDHQPRIIGCSSTFNQNTASLALLRRVKELCPDVVTVAGGANCEGEMGIAMLRDFEWIDYVASGESELFFPKFCQQILDGNEENMELPYGLLSKKTLSDEVSIDFAMKSPPRASVDNLDASPIPDFDDYFATLAKFSDRDFITPGLVMETARGCWWGAKNHCTFCGLNGGTMSFRPKSPDRVLEEMRHLSATYNVDRFLVADNILDVSYYKTVLPKLAELPQNYDLYFEIKSNVTFDQLERLSSAGCNWVVAGIESLHDEVLKTMNKGVSGAMNIQTLKWSRGLGIRMSWNMLCGFPDEDDNWYGEMAELLPLVHHLEPPNDIRKVRIDRFSPLHSKSDSYGIKISPAWPYQFIYPGDSEKHRNLVYFFEVEGNSPAHLNPFRHSRSADRLPSLGGPGRDTLQLKIHEWVQVYRSEKPAVLHMTQSDDQTFIVDTRPIAVREHHVLEGLSHRIHRACDRASSLSQLCKALEKDGGGEVAIEKIEAELKNLVDLKLIADVSNRFLSLAVKGEMPDLPWKNQDGFPGGWFAYPRPSQIPERMKEYSSAKESASAFS